MKENIAIVGGKKEFQPIPLLIAKDKNAKVYKDDYQIGWYYKDSDSDDWLWIVWGVCPNLDSAIKCANDVIKEKGERPIYLCDTALSRKLEIQTEKLILKQLNRPSY